MFGETEGDIEDAEGRDQAEGEDAEPDEEVLRDRGAYHSGGYAVAQELAPRGDATLESTDLGLQP